MSLACGRRTEGWAAGLCLAGLSMRGREDLRAFVDQFAGTIGTSSTTSGARCSRICRAIFDASCCGRRCSTNSPHRCAMPSPVSTTPRICCPSSSGPTPSWSGSTADANRFRYHHLFAELLRHELARSEPDLLPELHRRAGRWSWNTGASRTPSRTPPPRVRAGGPPTWSARVGATSSNGAASPRCPAGWISSPWSKCSATATLPHTGVGRHQRRPARRPRLLGGCRRAVREPGARCEDAARNRGRRRECFGASSGTCQVT